MINKLPGHRLNFIIIFGELYIHSTLVEEFGYNLVYLTKTNGKTEMGPKILISPFNQS